jgi:hypothetical protein
LGKRGKTNHVSEHNGSKPTLAVRLLIIFHSTLDPLAKIDFAL